MQPWIKCHRYATATERVAGGQTSFWVHPVKWLMKLLKQVIALDHFLGVIATKLVRNAVLPIRPEVCDWSFQREPITEVAVITVVLEHLQRHPPLVWAQVLTPVSEQRWVRERRVRLTVLALRRSLWRVTGRQKTQDVGVTFKEYGKNEQADIIRVTNAVFLAL